MNAFPGNPFSKEILIGVLGRREKQIRHLIGQQAINFLRHCAVERSQSGFNMRYGQMQFATDQSGCKCGIHIAIDNDEVGFFVNYDLLESQHDTAGLLRVGAGANCEIEIRLRNPKLLKENVRHRPIIMLACV